MKLAVKPNPSTRAACAALLCLLAAGCASTASDAGPGVRGAVDTGTYPNLNIPAPVATKQFDGESLAAHNQALGSARAGQNQDGREAAALASASNAEQARLRRLAARHGADTLKEIEAR